ncbi:MAG: DUF2845 domain-containing protein [Syntrophales bacterium]|nr:DUF2845 domain-containing protein [Syntrophales bacterium]
MDAFALLRNPKRFKTMFFAFLVSGFLWTSPAAASDMMSTICNNEVVSVGARRGEVMAKCGKPLSTSRETVSKETSQALKRKKAGKKKTDKDDKDRVVATKKNTTKEQAETWTYNIDGSYRFFIFKEGKLANIEAGGLVN